MKKPKYRMDFNFHDWFTTCFDIGYIYIVTCLQMKPLRRVHKPALKLVASLQSVKTR